MELVKDRRIDQAMVPMKTTTATNHVGKRAMVADKLGLRLMDIGQLVDGWKAGLAPPREAAAGTGAILLEDGEEIFGRGGRIIRAAAPVFVDEVVECANLLGRQHDRLVRYDCTRSH